MFGPSFDLSEYQRPESADCHAQWNGCTDLSPSFFENSVSYFAEEKKLYIQVSPVYEFEAMFDLYEDLGYPIPENYQKEPTEQEEELFPVLSEVFYSSIYTAAFPPQFAQATEKALEYYQQYLSLLQSEFLELLEFCLDKNFHPKVLGQLYPSERYSLWC